MANFRHNVYQGVVNHGVNTFARGYSHGMTLFQNLANFYAIPLAEARSTAIPDAIPLAACGPAKHFML